MDNQFKPTHSGTPPEPPVDVRVSLTKTIWVFATAMMGISIPMVGLTRSLTLPMCIIAAATAATVAVCLGKGGGETNSTRALADTQEQLRQLEERLSHVETISRFERSLHERDTMTGANALSGAEEVPPPAQEGTRSVPRPSNPISY